MSSISFLTHIPNPIKNKVIDKDWTKVFIFEEMPCKHTQDALQYEKLDCERCQANEKETWLENTLAKQDPNATITDKDNKILTLSKITVKRGKYDDCVGIQCDWN